MARMSWSEACQLDETLVGLEHFFSTSPSYAQTLTGGLTNRCWKIVLPDESAFVWRPTTHLTKAFSISRFQEYQILSSIEDSQIGPKPWFINEKGLLVEWIEGSPLTDTLTFDELLETMVQIHQLDTTRVPAVPFSFTARVDHYWMKLTAENRCKEVEAIYQRWRNAPNLAEVGQTLCHFDLAGYNMVATRTSIE